MDCAEEVSLLRRELSRLRGIYDLSFDILSARMTVEHDPELLAAQGIADAVARTGMRAEPWREAPEHTSLWQRRGRELMAAVSGAALLAGMVAASLYSGEILQVLSHEGHDRMPAPILALFLLAIVTGVFFSVPKAVHSMRHLRPDMNALVVISISGALVLGEWTEGATVAFLFAVAVLLESWSIARARNAIGSLLRIAPNEATVMHDHGEHRMPVSRVEVGSIVRVKPGERIPFDGEVISGISGVNQALITGESVPILKQPGSLVYAGTMNGEGSIEIRTTRAASDTTLARIIRMVEDSQRRRAPSEQWVERFARVYTPVMMGLALLVAVVPPLAMGGAWSEWFYQSMVVLLISCPCALVISTPVSIVAALTSAARHGVLVKGGAFLEQAARLKAVAFDKTGVLTAGEPVVRSVLPMNGFTHEQVVHRVAGIEQRSEHPLASAILRYAESQGIRPAPANNFHALIGRGAEAEIEGRNFWVGSNRLLLEKHVKTSGLTVPKAGADETLVLCGAEDELWAVVAIADRVRPEARSAVAALRKAGIEIVAMLTGDNQPTAKSVAGEIGIDYVRAELLPDDKVAAIRELGERHGPVAMVGDGINDAQAMGEASLGIALGRRGADVALETADVVLMADDLSRLPFLVRHAKRTLGIVQQNVIFALATKAVFLGLAFFGMATLWMAIAADMGATLAVTFNGLRLLRAKSSTGKDVSGF